MEGSTTFGPKQVSGTEYYSNSNSGNKTHTSTRSKGDKNRRVQHTAIKQGQNTIRIRAGSDIKENKSTHG
jgi:hypothetical protein